MEFSLEILRIFDTLINNDCNKKIDIDKFQDEMKIIFEKVKKSVEENKDKLFYMTLSDMYYYGIGTEQDLKLAGKYFRLAVNNHTENTSLAYLLANAFMRIAGDAIKREDVEEYIKNLEYSFRFGGFIGAAYLLGDHYYFEAEKHYFEPELAKQEFEKTIKYLEMGAKQTEQDTKHRRNRSLDNEHAGKIYDKLGVIYDKIGNAEKTVLNYKKGASLGNGDAYYHIGKLYLEGHIFEKDFDEARDYFDRAIYHGSELAKHSVWCFEEGINKK